MDGTTIFMPRDIALIAVKQWLTVEEAAIVLDVSADKVRRLVQSREIAHSRRGHRVYICKLDIDAWLEASRVESAGALESVACTYTASYPYGRKRRG